MSPRKKQKINPDNLAPGIAEGFTQDASFEEAMQEADHKKPLSKKGAQVGHLAAVDSKLEKSRGGFASFVATNDASAVWSDGVTDRPQYDLHKTYSAGGMRLLREGRQCLRCDEPFDQSFPAGCPVCGYPVRDRQIMDMAMEFEGERHLGPSKPISSYMQEQEVRLEKRRFIRRVLDGGQGKVPKEWLKDDTMLEGLTLQEKAAIGASQN